MKLKIPWITFCFLLSIAFSAFFSACGASSQDINRCDTKNVPKDAIAANNKTLFGCPVYVLAQKGVVNPQILSTETDLTVKNFTLTEEGVKFRYKAELTNNTNYYWITGLVNADGTLAETPHLLTCPTDAQKTEPPITNCFE